MDIFGVNCCIYWAWLGVHYFAWSIVILEKKNEEEKNERGGKIGKRIKGE